MSIVSSFINNQRETRRIGVFNETPCKLVDFLGGVNYTPSQDNNEIFNHSVGFLQKILAEIEVEKGWKHFKFFIMEKNDRFFVGISHMKSWRTLPKQTFNCLSCNSESETNKVSRIDFPATIGDNTKKLLNLWLDAKARSIFIVTPVRHVERLSECNDDELFSIFHLATQILDEETKVSKVPWGGMRFLRMTLNHGNLRNLKHLHLKISVKRQDFRYFEDHGWDNVKRYKFKILENSLYKKDKRVQKVS
ncbi:4505_t:CDS:2 [Dentiscutata heterogama]|uniref:4505_t:CDS:1 n=1 Tax=Dentiscutata heterogama TaxID=1316150 RepID=A0ACA9L277_9GLOM|nr:4505_t:CDS:2 [Dentiscutata heterogama]